VEALVELELDGAGGQFDGREGFDGREAVRARETGCRSAAVDRADVDDGFAAGVLTAGVAGVSVTAGAVVRLFSVSVTEPEGKFTSCVEPSCVGVSTAGCVRFAMYAPPPAATTPTTTRAPNAARFVNMGILLDTLSQQGPYPSRAVENG
jgi:hypothetical protein